MTEEKAIPLLVRPIISYPQEVEESQRDLMGIDFDHLQDEDKEGQRDLMGIDLDHLQDEGKSDFMGIDLDHLQDGDKSPYKKEKYPVNSTKEQAISLKVRPIISYPQEAEVGKSYLMTIDLDHLQDGDKWPYEGEEYPVYCMLHTSPLFTNKPLDTPAVVLHRFGGSYGPAKFILTAAEKVRKGEIRVTLVNKQGVPLRVIKLPEIRVVQEASRKARVVGTLEARQQRSDTSKSTPAEKPVTPIEREPDKMPQKPSLYKERKISLTKLHHDVHQALKMWYRDSSDGCPIDYLYLFRQAQREQYSSQRAMIQVLFKGLKALQAERPEYADLLEKRFRRGMSLAKVANKYGVSSSTVSKRQQRAIRSLAEKLQALEERAIAPYNAAVEKRLGPRTYLYLIGVEKHLEHLMNLLFSPEPPWLISIEGIGGIGKTTLADVLLRDEIILQSLFEDLGWVGAQQEIFNPWEGIKAINKRALTTEGLVEALVEQLLDLTPTQLSGKQAFDALYNCLKSYPHLIVIDSLETVQDVESLLPTLRRLANPTKFLLTSRRRLLTEPDIYQFIIPPLSEANALKLIREEIQRRNLPHLVQASDEDLLAIYEMVGGNPLALRLVVSQTHIEPLDVILDDLKAARSEMGENLNKYIYRRAWDSLDNIARKVFMFMPLAVDQDNQLDFLEVITGLEYRDIRRALNLLVTLNLVELRGEFGERRYTIHNLTRTFLQEQVIKWQKD